MNATTKQDFFRGLTKHAAERPEFDTTGIWMLVTKFLHAPIATTEEVYALPSIIAVLETISTEETTVIVLRHIQKKIEKEIEQNNISLSTATSLEDPLKKNILGFIENARILVKGLQERVIASL